MQNTLTYNKVIINITLLLLSLSGFFFIIFIDKKFLHIHNFEYGIPHFSLNYLIRTFSVFTFTLGLFHVLSYFLRIKHQDNNITLFDTSNFIDKWGFTSIISFSFIFFSLFLLKPIAFHELSQEDGLIEWGSAIFLFTASLVFLISWLKAEKNHAFKHFKWVCLLFSIAFFIVAMEEVSWFQRVINFETPNVFNKNLQNETNLHNFNTNYSENIYYFGAFVFLVVLPYFHLLFPKFLNNKNLIFYIPKPFIAIVSVIPCAFNYDRWDAFITQFTFFSCIIILVSFLLFNVKRIEKKIIWFIISVLIIYQSIFLIKGENYWGIYDLKEYKEFLIPLCFLIYSLDKFNDIKKQFN